MTAVPPRVAIARIIDPTAWKVDGDGFLVEQVHSGEALMKADAILELQDAATASQPAPSTLRNQGLSERDRAKAIRNRHLLHMAMSGDAAEHGDNWHEEAAIRAMIEFASPDEPFGTGS